ncbi:MAG TPA: porin family protein [Chitinophagaceae bacterium]|nr:porin family protein [Chitinophagaceae bacterium]
MKKVILLLAGVIAFASVSLAQGFHIGAKAGANLGKIHGQTFNDGFKLGYQLGGFAEIDFTKGFGIQPELLWSQTNTKVTDEPLSGLKPGADIHLNYLSVPVLLRLNPSKLITINVGPQFSILTNNHKTTLQNAGDAFKTGDFAMVAGAQVNVGALRVYGRYNIGLNNLNAITDSDKWRHQQFQFGLGLKIF